MKLRFPPHLFIWSIVSVLSALALGVIFVVLNPTNTFGATTIYVGALLIVLLVGFNIFQLLATNKTATLIASAMNDNLAEDTALFEELYRNSPVPYARIKKNGDVISVNASMLRFFKVEEGRLNDVSVYELVAATDETKASILPTEISRGQYINDIEVRAQNSDGIERWAFLSCFPYGNHNERLLTLFDITKQKEVDLAKSEFVSLASHQLRTPISAIKWNLELLVSDSLGPLTEAQTDYLKKVERNAEKMHLIVNDFLSVSQLEMGSFATEVKDVRLHDFLESVFEEFTDQIEQKQITFNKEYQPSELTLTIDERLLHNSISNLMSNAVKYTPEGGQITLGLETSAASIVFTISDTGIGIPPEEQDRLFTKFFRATNAKTDVTEGTGLGLYIVAQAVEKMHGTIAVTSAPETGTTFTVTIPRTA